MKIWNLGVLIFSMLLFLSLHAENTKQIKSKNEFGGKTYETTFKEGDKLFEQFKINKAITYYDLNNEMIMVEYYFTKDFAAKKNYEKKIEYYGKNRKVNKAEYIYTKKFADEKGVYKVIDIINEYGEVVQVLFFYNDKFINKHGFGNAIMYLAKGFLTKIEYHYTDDFAKKHGYKIREDQYVYDANGNKKVTVAILYDEGNKEVQRIENPTNLVEPER